jgi:hypothetical protein
MSRLVDFYRGSATDTEGRLLNDILAWPDGDLEAVHDFIQWLFALPEPSQFNSDAPLLTDEDIAAFKSDPLLQANLMKSFDRILAFLGLTLSDQGEVVEGQNFTARVPDVWGSPNHNWLRITRILRSLVLLGMEGKAQAFYQWLDAAYRSKRFPIPANTFRFWTKAVAG